MLNKLDTASREPTIAAEQPLMSEGHSSGVNVNALQGETRSALALRSDFTNTHWSVVLAAGQATSAASQVALEKLCRTYWYPLYAYVRRAGHGPEDAQDL